jgi:hypothetical protein
MARWVRYKAGADGSSVSWLSRGLACFTSSILPYGSQPGVFPEFLAKFWDEFFEA